MGSSPTSGICVQPQNACAPTSAQPGADVPNEDREIRTPNLLIWSQTRYRCAISPVQNRARRHTSDTNNKKRLNTAPLMQTNSPHWGLNPGPSVYKTDALPLSYRGAGPRISQNNRENQTTNGQERVCQLWGSNPRAVTCIGS